MMTRERGQRRRGAGWACWCRCASVSGVGVAVADELARQMLQRGRERARGKGAHLRRELGGPRALGRWPGLGAVAGLLEMLMLVVRATPC